MSVCQVPAHPTANLIEFETQKREYRISNNECRMSKECILSILKRLSKAKPSFEILRFDIRYSAVRGSVSMKFHTSGAAGLKKFTRLRRAASLIEKETNEH